MLYRTTRDKYDVVTAFKTVRADCNSDGGLFLPFRMPVLNRAQIQAIGTVSPTQTIANVLNELFGSGLTAWDIEAAIGRMPVRLSTVGRQVYAGELWHNNANCIDAFVRALSARIGSDGEEPTNWMEVAVRISLLYAAYGMMRSAENIRAGEKLDVATATGDFSMAAAAFYARQMGLPIGNIICGCNANGGFWDLLNRGEFATGERVISTWTAQADQVVPRNLERLIHGVFGVDENRRFLSCCCRGGTYTLNEEQQNMLGRGLFAAVISDSRTGTIITGVYRTRSYILSPYSALAYGSLQDFRATTGEENPTLLMADRSPMKDSGLVGKILKIKEEDLEKRVIRI